MSSLHALVASTLIVLLAASPAAAQSVGEPIAPTPAAVVALADASGSDLVRKLLDPRDRLGAVYELSRRGGVEKRPYATFAAEEPSAQVLVSRSPGGSGTVFAVLLRTRRGDAPFRGFDDDPGLFGPASLEAGRIARGVTLLAYAADGRPLRSGGDDLVGGYIADVNGDGGLERVGDREPEQGVETLEIWPLEEGAGPSLAVAFNLLSDDWGYALLDPRGDGVLDVVMGPRPGAEVRPEVVIRWDRGARRYVAPERKDGDHFVVLEGSDVSGAARKLVADRLAGRLRFGPEAATPTATAATPPVPASDPVAAPPASEAAASPEPASASAAPYRYASLHGASDEAIAAFMAPGGHVEYHEPPPASGGEAPAWVTAFWKKPAREAVLELVEANRSPEHRDWYRVAILDRPAAPTACTIAYTWRNSGCYSAYDAHWVLRCDPAGSYLAYGDRSGHGHGGEGSRWQRAQVDLRWLSLSYEQARLVADRVFLLTRVRTRCRASRLPWDDGSIRTSADGGTWLEVRADDGSLALTAGGWSWYGAIADRWRDEYQERTLGNFAGLVFLDALPALLGAAWEDATSADPPRPSKRTMVEGEPAPAGLARARRRQRVEAARRILSTTAAQGERGMSHELAEVAAQVAKDEGVAAVADDLRRLAADPAVPEWMRGVMSAAVARLQVRDDAEALERLAAGYDPGSFTRDAVEPLEAGFRLAEVDPARGLFLLERWVGAADEYDAKEVFEALAERSPPLAVALLARLEPERAAKLRGEALLRHAEALEEAEAQADAFLALVATSDVGDDARKGLMRTLALGPTAGALAARIDDGLMGAFAPSRTAECRCLRETAATLLARRSCRRAFAPILAAADENDGGGLLSAAATLARGEDDHAALAEVVRARLGEAREGRDGALWAAWSADLRSLAPTVAEAATSFPARPGEGRSGTSPASERSHLARQITALWSEPDAFTRARMLLAFAIARHLAPGAPPDRLARLRAALVEVEPVLSAEQRAALAASVRAWESSGPRGPSEARMRSAAGRGGLSVFSGGR